MRAALFVEPRRVEAGDRPDPVIVEPTDAIVRAVLAYVCGSDLWYFRGDSPFEPGPIGHEFVGVVEDVGRDVATVRRGDFVIAPFAFSDGTCPHCRLGITSACVAGGFYPSNGDGGQGEAVRVPLAAGSLVTVPGSGHSDEMLTSLLTLSDVMATGHHAAVSAATAPSASRASWPPSGWVPRESSRSAATPHVRRSRASSAPATSSSSGEEATDAVMALTEGVGVDATVECVGTSQALPTALSIARPGSMVGYVGVPHGVELPIGEMFFGNKGVRGGSARHARTSPR
jgi:threonine dehydrogenase-like Zn-dependent dehydrogenase